MVTPTTSPSVQDGARWRASLPTIILLPVALAGPDAFVFASDALFGDSPGLRIEIVSQLIYCAMAGAVVLGVVYWEHLPLESIGMRRPEWSTVASAALVVIAGLVLQTFIIGRVAKSVGGPELEAGLQQLSRVPVWFRVFIGITGGIVEETLYRGYAMERLATLTGNRWLGAAIALMVFTLAHIPA